MTSDIALTWQLGSNFGWGLFGLHIALQLRMTGRANPVLLSEFSTYKGDPIEREALERIWRHNRPAITRIQNSRAAGDRVRLQIPVITALGNKAARPFVHPSFDYRGTVNHGLVFLVDGPDQKSPTCSAENRREPAFSTAPSVGVNPLENAWSTDQAFAHYDGYDTLTAGSTWARDVLRERGVARTETCIQGVDQSLFRPQPRRGYLKDRFVIFSGGKLEFRKSQDIVIEAVNRFRERHPETLLLCVWDNPWPTGAFVKLLDRSPYYPDLLDHVHGNRIDWPALLTAVGLPDTAVRIFKTVENRSLPFVMREADVALFPNRCEGGTNMMAMQAMACGIPTILSANTGHFDIIADGACLPLTRQQPVTVAQPEIHTDGWGESDVDEILDALEQVYRDRETARKIGATGASLMQRYTWDTQIAHLADLIGL